MGPTAAAASCFYGILALFPLIIAFVQSAFLIVGQDPLVEQQLFALLREFSPSFANELIPMVHGILKRQDEAAWGWAQIANLAILSWSGIGLFRSFFEGIELVGRKNAHIKGIRKQYLRSLAILGTTLLSVLLLTYITPLSFLVLKAFQSNYFAVAVGNVFGNDFWLAKMLRLEWLGPILKVLLNSTVFYFICFLIYFCLLFRLLLGPKVSGTAILFGSSFFVVCFLLAKNVFWIYFNYAKGPFQERYGALYVIILSVLWGYYLLLTFFLSVQIALERNSSKNPQASVKLEEQ